MSPAYPARGVVAVAALAGGMAVGVAAVLLHGYWWGLLVGVAAIGTLLWAVPGGWWRRLPVALGWSVAVLVLAVERPEGDYLVESSGRGYLLLAVGVAVLLGGAVGLRRRKSPDATINGNAAPPS